MTPWRRRHKGKPRIFAVPVAKPESLAYRVITYDGAAMHSAGMKGSECREFDQHVPLRDRHAEVGTPLWPCLRRSTISARIERAISSGVIAPRSRPAGAFTTEKRSSETPPSVKWLCRAAIFLREPTKATWSQRLAKAARRRSAPLKACCSSFGAQIAMPRRLPAWRPAPIKPQARAYARRASCGRSLKGLRFERGAQETGNNRPLPSALHKTLQFRRPPAI